MKIKVAVSAKWHLRVHEGNHKETVIVEDFDMSDEAELEDIMVQALRKMGFENVRLLDLKHHQARFHCKFIGLDRKAIVHVSARYGIVHHSYFLGFSLDDLERVQQT